MCGLNNRQQTLVRNVEALSERPVAQGRPVRCNNDEPQTARLQVRVHGGGNDLDGVVVTATPQPAGAAMVQATGQGAPAGRADFGDVATGTWRITIAFVAGDANDGGYVVRPGHVDVDLAAGDDRNVDVEVDPKIRIRLGWQEPGVADRTWVRFYLPRITGSGGAGNGHVMRVRLDLSAGRLEYHGTNPANPVLQTFPAGAHFQDLPAQAGQWHYAQLRGAGANIQVDLWERAFARDTPAFNAPALIPWNFYFWSSSRRMAAGATSPVAFLAHNDARNVSGYSPFQKFDQAFGLGTASFTWESNPAHDGHNDLAMAQPNPITWQGHCNWMGAASIIFQPPVVAVGPNAVNFDIEELKLFAAEFAANNVDSTRVWDLTTYPAPESATSAVHLVPRHTRDDATAVDWKRRQAANDRQWSGQVAEGFWATLRAELAGQGSPLLLDMRAVHNTNNPRGSSDEIWNQALFHYEAWYREHPSAQNAHAGDRQAQDLQITLQIYANADDFLPSTNPPATYGAGDVTVQPNHWRRDYMFRLQCSPTGDVVAGDALNSWEDADSGGNPCYMPRYLSRINGIRPAPINAGGNPHVTAQRVQQLGLQRRIRYP